MDERCNGDDSLRAEVERLLASCDSEFLKVPAGVDLTNGDSNRSNKAMNPSDYQKVKEIFHSVVEIEPEGRDAFLDERCNGDDSLRAEVERLLASCDSEFLKVPAGVDLTNGDSNRSSRSGQQIGHYTIREKIGSGGMGDVYLAEDGKLRRRVAIKFLPEGLTNDPDRLHRFEQEAQTASALNHPNILTVYEIGETDDTHYIATEYIDGETLRSKLNRGKLTPDEALDIAVQCASALSAAHENGIIHRDIKPENIMLRRDNLVKVLDFGLAKLVEKKNVTVSHDALTEKHVKTAPGVIMGTVQYMSPEQTRGHATDARTDIWSFGCVVYEMIAGKPPFAGDNTADLIVEIVKTHPVPLSKIDADLPERLDEIVAKALEKAPNERYQTAKDLLLDLKRLKRKLDLENESERSNFSATNSGNIIGTGEATGKVTAQDRKDTVSSAEYIVSEIKQHRLGIFLTFITIAALVGGAFYLYRYLSITDAAQTPVPESPAQTQRLTGDGKTSDAVISPDGKFLAYVKSESGQQSLWVKQISTNSNLKVVPENQFNSLGGMTFSPDGSFIYFTAATQNDNGGSIYSVPTLGGSNLRIIPNALSPSFSQDGKRVVFSRIKFLPDGVESRLVMADANGNSERDLATLPKNQMCVASAWSPDGSLISCPVIEGDKNWIAIIDASDGNMKELPQTAATFVTSTAWLPDMSAIVFAGSDSKGGGIWEISYPRGEIRRLTNNLNAYSGISITSDGKAIVTVENEFRSGIWVARDADAKSARPITSGKGRYPGISWTPDGRIVYVNNASGEFELWKMNPDGSDARQLTNDRLWKNLPTVSADGRYIVYQAGDDNNHIWRANSDGGNLIELTTGKSETWPDISPDNKWVVYTSLTSGKPAIWRVPLEGGAAQQITNSGSMYGPRISPDGKQISVLMMDDQTETISIAIIPFEGGEPIKQFDVPPTIDFFPAEWNPDGKGITYIVGPKGAGNLWLQPINGGKPTPLTDYKENGVWHREWSRDGKQVALVRGELNHDAIMISNFR